MSGTDTGQSVPGSADGKTVVAVHQPNYLPWFGYFHKIHRADVFVFLDDVEYTSGSWINRNRIKTPDGWTWLTVPVRDSGGPIAEVRIARERRWQEVHRKSLQQNYGKASHFEEVFPLFERLYDREWEWLHELNVAAVEHVADEIGLECRFVRSSALSVETTRTDRLVDICERLDADRYLSGTGARSYTDPDRFDEAGIELEYQSFEHPRYEQRFDSFVPELSIVDVLMNVGTTGTRDFLQSV